LFRKNNQQNTPPTLTCHTPLSTITQCCAIVYDFFIAITLIMTITADDLNKIAGLAYLSSTAHDALALQNDINAIMNFVEQLSTVDTVNIMPLSHPLSINQRQRPDVVTEDNRVEALEAMAPKFSNQFYLVPKVIEG
jgi:aspartyl-tRNA(Asn)/glutamyl-tRNA(Gln) amidotransferase subunit C